MTGNSPKSDLNCALEASLNVVFIQHTTAWTLEREESCGPGPDVLLVLERFADLKNVF